MHSNEISQNANHAPPGTVLLLGVNLEHDISEISLEPRPTSDPNDPLNWSNKRKWINLTLALSVTAIVYTTIQPVFWQLLVVDLSITYPQLITTFALMLCGFGSGCVFVIPLAVKYGRRPIYTLSVGFLLAFTIWMARMETVREVYAASFLAGFAGAPNETIVQMTIADLFFVHQRGTANGYYMAVLMTGSYLAPAIAGFMATAYGWRDCYWALTAFTGVIFILFVCCYEETKYEPATPEVSLSNISDPNLGGDIDTEKSKNDESPTTEADRDFHRGLHSAQHVVDKSIPMNTWRQRLRLITPTDESLWTLMYRPFIILFSFPAVLYTALQYGLGLACISLISNTTSSLMPIPPYDFKPNAIGLMSLAPFIGCILGAVYGGLFADWTILRLAKRNGGYYEPEMRLQLLHIPAIALPGGLLMFGLTISRGMHWILPAIGMVVFGFGVGSIWDTALTLVIDSYRDLTGEAFIAIAFCRNIVAIALVFGYTPWVEAQGYQGMFIVCSVVCLVICLSYIPLMIWGKRIRQKTAGKYREFVMRCGSSRM